MNTQETNYSLCVTICLKNKYTELLRLADIIKSTKNSGNTGGRLLPFDKNSFLPNVKTISMDKRQANPNELCIWEWELQPDNPDKQYSTRSDMTFYELVFLNNGLTINPLPIWDLFDTLLDGFIVPLQHSKSFLLVINQTPTEYICLEITESSYSCDGNKIKIHENTYLKEYKISKSDVIDTNEYVSNLGASIYSLDLALERRIIYKRRTIYVDPIATLTLKRFNKHLAEYLEQVVTRLPGQAGDKTVIKNFIKSVTEDVKPDSDLMTFIREYYSQPKKGSSAPTLEKYSQLESVFTSYLRRTSTDKKFLKYMVEYLPSLRKEYLQILTDTYLEEEKQKTDRYLEEEKQKLLHHLIPLQTQIEEMNNDLKEKNTQKEELDAKIISLTNSLKELLAQTRESEQRRQELDELLNGKRTGLLQELAILKKVLQLDETTFETSTQNSNSSVLTIRPGNSVEYEDEDPTEIKDLSCMYSILQDNLPGQGADAHNLSDLSKFISALYLCHLPLLCVGSSAGDMARIISISLNNQLPDTVCVPTGYNNYSSFLSTIRNLKSDIVVLENVVGYCDEYCYTHLTEDIPEKYIIFLVEYEETLKLLPKGIYAHMGLIHCDKLFTTQLTSDERPYPGKITGSISSSPDIATRRELFGKISKLTRCSAVSNGYVNSRVKVLQAITQNGDNIAEVLKVIYTELISINEIYGLSEEYIDELRTSTDSVVKNFRGRLEVET
jgi:hypothetical protein